MHVMAQGRMSPSLSREQATVAKIGSWMSGLWTETEEAVN
jgi:simple sugar transport system ATP-binding protein